jgi:plasmid stabilization system protein ParE
MPRLIWSPQALRDLSRLHGFLADKNPPAARRAVAIIRSSVKVIAAHPEIGRQIENVPAEFREWPISFGASGYVAFYRVGGSEIIILTLWHGRELGN